MPAARAPRQGAHAPAPPPGPGGSLHLSLPGCLGRRCKANFGKKFFGGDLGLEVLSPALSNLGSLSKKCCKKAKPAGRGTRL